MTKQNILSDLLGTTVQITMALPEEKWVATRDPSSASAAWRNLGYCGKVRAVYYNGTEVMFLLEMLPDIPSAGSLEEFYATHCSVLKA